MCKKLFFSCTTTFILSFAFQGVAYSNPTQWERVDTTLSGLLNSGWQLLGISSNRAAYQSSFSPNGFDETSFIFSLTKNGKHIICYLDNPKPPIAQIAGCRKIN
jgi:hypothetical protein